MLPPRKPKAGDWWRRFRSSPKLSKDQSRNKSHPSHCYINTLIIRQRPKSHKAYYKICTYHSSISFCEFFILESIRPSQIHTSSNKNEIYFTKSKWFMLHGRKALWKKNSGVEKFEFFNSWTPKSLGFKKFETWNFFQTGFRPCSIDWRIQICSTKYFWHRPAPYRWISPLTVDSVH